VSRDSSPEATVAQVFDEGAAAYEEHWAPALHRHARDLVEIIPAPAPGSRRVVIDVAAGAGTLVSELGKVAGTDGLVVALDRSLGMLRRAPTDVVRIQGDAARLPLASDSADVVVLAFVLFMLPDARAAVTEVARVLRQDGWLLAATWGAQLETAADVVVREEIEAADPPPFPVLPRSDELTDSAEHLVDLLTPAGFGNIRTTKRSTPAPWWPWGPASASSAGGTHAWTGRPRMASGSEPLADSLPCRPISSSTAPRCCSRPRAGTEQALTTTAWRGARGPRPASA
jgi:ubiquinone/menaquinone biosynthesis C-methylase UbiE